MSEALDLIWRRADVQGHVISHAELAAWPHGERKTIVDLGLIRRTTDATALICDDCGESHAAEIVRDARRPELPYYRCPRIGRVPIAVEATHQWEVDVDRLAALIRKALGLGGKASTLTPSRIWLLGRQQQAGGFWELFLVRGICWPDGVGLLDQCLRLPAKDSAIVNAVALSAQAFLAALQKQTAGLHLSHPELVAAFTGGSAAGPVKLSRGDKSRLKQIRARMEKAQKALATQKGGK